MRARDRLAIVDVARGLALVAMAAYHASWDASFLGLARIELYDAPFWLAARTGILSAFLVLAGISLVLGERGGFDPRRWARRLGLLALAAAAVSLVSVLAFPDSPIFFGVLHLMLVASVLGRLFLGWPAPLILALGVLVFVLPDHWSNPLFDAAPLSWVGLGTHPPNSNDYVPVFPWFGVFLAGMAVAKLGRDPGGAALGKRLAGWRPKGGLGRAGVWAGRHSLALYLVHQPVLLALAWTLAQALGASDSDTRAFLDQCQARCAPGEGCRSYCVCVVDDLKAQALWEDLVHGRTEVATSSSITSVIASCRRRAQP